MNVKWLKIIAMLTMLIDHIGARLYPQIPFLRFIGRIAFVLYAFMASEGIKKTRNKEKYLGKLLLFAFLSEIPFDLSRKNMLFDWSYQNVIFTLFFGTFTLYVYEKTKNKLYLAITAVLSMIVLIFMKTDYCLLGIPLIVGLHLCNVENDLERKFGIAFVVICFSLLNIIFYTDIKLSLEFLRNISKSTFWIHFGELMAIPILCSYNGLKGYKSKIFSWFYWLFYPGHAIILWLIKYHFAKI